MEYAKSGFPSSDSNTSISRKPILMVFFLPGMFISPYKSDYPFIYLKHLYATLLSSLGSLSWQTMKTINIFRMVLKNKIKHKDITLDTQSQAGTEWKWSLIPYFLSWYIHWEPSPWVYHGNLLGDQTSQTKGSKQLESIDSSPNGRKLTVGSHKDQYWCWCYLIYS